MFVGFLFMTIECLRSVHSIVYKKNFVNIINMTYSCRVVLDMICMECGNYEDR